MGEARGSKGGSSPVGGLQFKSKRNGRYAIRGLGAWTIGAVEISGIAADCRCDGVINWQILSNLGEVKVGTDVLRHPIQDGMETPVYSFGC